MKWNDGYEDLGFVLLIVLVIMIWGWMASG